ncbi:MAG: hypothetical protein ACP5M4_01330 [Acidobacteriaceae bacterium]
MTFYIENKELLPEENLPTTGDVPPKVVTGKFAGLGTGVLLAGGAVVGCFALALWNRKALAALVKNRGHRREPAETDSTDDTDAIY